MRYNLIMRESPAILAGLPCYALYILLAVARYSNPEWGKVASILNVD